MAGVYTAAGEAADVTLGFRPPGLEFARRRWRQKTDGEHAEYLSGSKRRWSHGIGGVLLRLHLHQNPALRQKVEFIYFQQGSQGVEALFCGPRRRHCIPTGAALNCTLLLFQNWSRYAHLVPQVRHINTLDVTFQTPQHFDSSCAVELRAIPANDASGVHRRQLDTCCSSQLICTPYSAHGSGVMETSWWRFPLPFLLETNGNCQCVMWTIWTICNFILDSFNGNALTDTGRSFSLCIDRVNDKSMFLW